VSTILPRSGAVCAHSRRRGWHVKPQPAQVRPDRLVQPPPFRHLRRHLRRQPLHLLLERLPVRLPGAAPTYRPGVRPCPDLCPASAELGVSKNPSHVARVDPPSRRSRPPEPPRQLGLEHLTATVDVGAPHRISSSQPTTGSPDRSRAWLFARPPRSWHTATRRTGWWRSASIATHEPHAHRDRR
jgi:hypothetical protein